MERVAEPIAAALAIGILGRWAEVGSDIQILAVSGLGGAVFRAFLFPEIKPGRRLLQAGAGMLSAVFLGGIAAHLLPLGGTDLVWRLMGSGFLFGAGGELAVKRIQDKLYGGGS